MALHTLYGVCASCGHTGAAHSPRGGCVAQVARGIAGGRRVAQCRCKVFVPPKEERADPTMAGPLRTDNLGLPTREHPGMGPPK